MIENKKKWIIFIIVTLLMIQVNAMGKKDEVLIKQTLNIGISKTISHAALNETEKGLMDYVNQSGVDVNFEVIDCEAKYSVAVTVANLFKKEKKDIVVGIATPASQALHFVYSSFNNDTPIIYAGITDPEAAGLDIGTKSSANACCIADINTIKLQLDTFFKVAKTKKLGMIYTKGEANGISEKNKVEQYCLQNGIEFVSKGINSQSEISEATLSIIKDVDSFFVGKDNTIVNSIFYVDEICKEYNVPLFNSDISSSIGTDFLMCWGLDYYEVGKLCGKLIIRIINGENPKDIGIVRISNVNNFKLFLNLDRAKELGIDLTEDVLETASLVVKDGKVINI